MLSMKNQGDIQNPCLKLGILAVGSQDVQDILGG
jgi:hypothetical protein